MHKIHALAIALAGALTAPWGTAMAQTADPVRIQQRHESILGKPLRIAPPKEVSEEQRQLVAPPSGRGQPGEIAQNFAIMLHTPELLKVYRPMGFYFLDHGRMAVRDRELVILRVGWKCQSPFEYGEHVRIAKTKGGITTEEIERVQVGSTAPGWSDHDRALLRSVEELFDNAMISDATWAELKKTMSDAQLVELPILVGQYQGVAYFMNSLGVRLREGNPGLAAK